MMMRQLHDEHMFNEREMPRVHESAYIKSSMENFALLGDGGVDSLRRWCPYANEVLCPVQARLSSNSKRARFLWTVVVMTCPRERNPLTVAWSGEECS